MKTALRIPLALMSFALLVGCGLSPGQHAFNKSRSYDETFDAAWDRLLQYFTERDFTVVQESRDDSLGRISVRKGIITHDVIADCGTYDIGLPFSPMYSYPDMVNASLTAVVTKDEEDRANVKIDADLSVLKEIGYMDGLYKVGSRLKNIHCTSTGVLEQQILNSL